METHVIRLTTGMLASGLQRFLKRLIALRVNGDHGIAKINGHFGNQFQKARLAAARGPNQQAITNEVLDWNE